MKTILSLIITIFAIGLGFSQTSSELKEIKSRLENQKIDLRENILQIEKKIDPLGIEITFVEVKEKSVKTVLKRNSVLYLKPSEHSSEIEKPKAKEVILVIEKYKYSDYYKCIYI